MKESGPKIEHAGSEVSDKKRFEEYIRELNLSPEDLSGKILDVGSGFSQFAKYAKEHGISSKIYSLEPQSHLISSPDKAVQADVRHIPFKDRSFDRVISHSGIPMVLAPESREKDIIENPDKLGINLFQSLLEMLRVLKTGGRIILSPIPAGQIYKRHMILNQELDKILHELELQGKIAIEAIVDHGQADLGDRSEQWYSIKIKKLR